MLFSKFPGGIWVVALLAAVSLSGCSAVKTLAEARTMEQEIRRDRIKHYKYIGDIYFVLGLDYYGLAKEAEAKNETEKAREYATKAKLYHFIYQEMNREVKRLSAELGQKDAPEDGAAGPESPSLVPRW